jgi:hypothetical protein
MPMNRANISDALQAYVHDADLFRDTLARN